MDIQQQLILRISPIPKYVLEVSAKPKALLLNWVKTVDWAYPLLKFQLPEAGIYDGAQPAIFELELLVVGLPKLELNIILFTQEQVVGVGRKLPHPDAWHSIRLAKDPVFVMLPGIHCPVKV